ncbi:MAG: T9SS type A sorting domain-containing protein [Bacteroidetes bacterium]|nr:T9SS type A sorting domain-containing protein [Bacteroidota bacterium]
MTKTFTFFLALILLTGFNTKEAGAQTFEWAQKIGGNNSSNDDQGEFITTDSLGYVYIGGHFEGTCDFDPGGGTYNLTALGTQDMFVCKLDSLGNFIWARQLGNSTGSNLMEKLRTVKLDDTMNVYLAGNFESTVDFDPEGGVFNLTSNGNADAFVLKLTTNGSFVWVKVVGSAGYDYCSDVAIDGQGKVVATGSFSSTVDFDPGISVFNITSNGNSDIFILKLTSSGNFDWAENIGGSGPDAGFEINMLPSKNIAIAGTFEGTVDFDPGSGTFNLTENAQLRSIFIVSLDSLGNFNWANKIDGSSNSSIGLGDMAIGSGGDIHIAADFNYTLYVDTNTFTATNIQSNDDIVVVKYNMAGNHQWSFQLGTTNSDRSYGVAVDDEKSVYLAGSIGTFTGDVDPSSNIFNLGSKGFIAKYDSSGSFVWANNIAATPSNPTRVYGIAVDYTRNVYSTGYFYNTADFNHEVGVLSYTPAGKDAFVKKISQCKNPVTASAPVFSINNCPPYTLKANSNAQLNGANNWYWHTGNCGDTLVGIGTSIIMDPDTNTTYYVRGEGQCVSPGSCASITVNGFPFPQVGNDTTICEGDTLILDAGTGYNSYAWSTGATTQTIDVFATSGYNVTVTNSSNCPKTSYINVIVSIAPALNIGADTALCAGETLSLDAGSGMQSYSWNIGNTSQSIVVDTAGVYSVTITDNNGCQNVDSMALSINSLPTVYLGNDTNICQFDTLVLTAGNFTSYLWQDLSTSASFLVDGNITGVGVFNYNVEVTDTNGCVNSDTITVTVDICAGIDNKCNNILLTPPYPNPTTETLFINTGNVGYNSVFKLIAANGRIVSEGIVKAGTVNLIDVSSMASGIYFLEIAGSKRYKIAVY